MRWYDAYGVRIRSELPIPVLEPVSENPGDDVPEVTVVESTVDITDAADGSPGGNVTGLVTASPREAYFRYEVGEFAVEDGTTITVDRRAGSTPGRLQSYLLGPIFGALCHQRGWLVLHGACVTRRGKTVALLGNKKAGKSTLAAAACREGWTLVTDDLVPVVSLQSGRPPMPGASERTPREGVPVVADQPTVVPGFPAVKLDEPTATRFDYPEPDRPIEGHSKEFYAIPQFATGPTGLDVVYVLDPELPPRVVPMSPHNRAIEMLRHSYAAPLVEETKTGQTHFEACTALANQVRIARIGRGSDPETVHDSLEIISADLGFRE